MFMIRFQTVPIVCQHNVRTRIQCTSPFDIYEANSESSAESFKLTSYYCLFHRQERCGSREIYSCCDPPEKSQIRGWRRNIFKTANLKYQLASFSLVLTFSLVSLHLQKPPIILRLDALCIITRSC